MTIVRLPRTRSSRRNLQLALLASLTAAFGAAAARADGFLIDSTDGTAQGALAGDVPGLVKIDARFTNSDHKLQVIKFAPHTLSTPWDIFSVRLEDGTHGAGFPPGGEDPIAGSVQWEDLRALGTIRQVYRTGCSGTCDIPIPPQLQSQDFVLLGFVLEFTDSDHNVREIGVNTNPDGVYNGFVQVKYSDVSGNRPYNAFVQYTMIPNSRVARHITASASEPAYGVATAARVPGRALLRGFRLNFTQGDHYLYRFTVDLSPSNAMVFRLRDSNTDDPFLWWVRYLTLTD